MCDETPRFHRELVCDELAPRRARALFSEWICEPHASVCLEDALLLLSEVVTNAVLHAGPPLEVEFDIDAEQLRVAVHDGAHDMTAPLDRVDDAVEWDDAGLESLPLHGRGLPLLDSLAMGWTLEPDDAGKTVAFSLNCALR